MRSREDSLLRIIYLEGIESVKSMKNVIDMKNEMCYIVTRNPNYIWREP